MFTGSRYDFCVLSFENKDGRTAHTKYLPTLEMMDYNIIIDGKNCFHQPIRNNLITNQDIRKIATVKGEDYATVWLLDYGYLKNFYRMNLSNTQELDSDPKAIQQIIFTANLDRDGIIKCFSLLIKEKGTILEL